MRTYIRPSASVPTVGVVSGAQSRRPLSSEMHYGEARRETVTAEPCPSLRALGRSQGYVGSHQGRFCGTAQRKPVDLYSTGREAPPSKSWKDSGLPYRSSIGKLSR